MQDKNAVQADAVEATDVVHISSDVIICRADPDRTEENWQEYKKAGEPPFDDDAELYKGL